MPRIAGVDIPDNKRVDISLTYIYGIGPKISRDILKNANIEPTTKTKDLTDSDVSKIRQYIESDCLVEGELRVEVQNNINGNYKIVVCLTESNVVNWQKDGQQNVENYEHNHKYTTLLYQALYSTNFLKYLLRD